MEKHVTFVGALQIGYNAFGILAAMFVFLFVVGGGLIAGLVSDDEIVIPITFFLGTLIAMWLVVISVPGIIGGIGVLRRLSWARYLVLVLSVLDLFSVPIGTAIGAYSIWALLQDETAKLFAPQGSRQS
jgi:phage shock protein PspC (stress-responsive transcriptional regulator)